MAVSAKPVRGLIANKALCVRFGWIALVLAVLSLGAKHVAIGGIGLYQRFLSPYKGYQCAYRVCYGGSSYSEYGRQVISDRGLVAGTVLLWHRFADCGQAAARIATTPTRAHYQGCEDCSRCAHPSRRPGKKAPEQGPGAWGAKCFPANVVLPYLLSSALIALGAYWILRRR
jgi:putative component of membrane protein insertase Oxa1/YidC/SpoIIIJ protein YidD